MPIQSCQLRLGLESGGKKLEKASPGGCRGRDGHHARSGGQQYMLRESTAAATKNDPQAEPTAESHKRFAHA